MKLSLGLSLHIERREALGDWISLTLNQTVYGMDSVEPVGNITTHLTREQMEALGKALLTAVDAYDANPVGTRVFLHSLRLGEAETTLDVDGVEINPNINIFTTVTK